MIYLDCAATTLQKPCSVAEAMAWSVKHLASPGRGGHYPAMEAGNMVFQCRQAAADLFQVKTPEQVVFTSNATHGLNIAIKTLVKPGDVVLVSGYEHNAVTRPLSAIPNVVLKVVFTPLFRSDLFLDEFKRQLTNDVSVVVCTYVSNVFGFMLPIREIADLCRVKGISFILDASQAAGCLPIQFEELGADFVAFPGHKGLYGPQGTGILLCKGETQPLLQGGTGSVSLRQEMPDFLPDRLEAGTHNVPGIAGLLEGIRFIRKTGEKEIFSHEQKLISRVVENLWKIPGIRVYVDQNMRNQSGVCSFYCDKMDCEELGAELGKRGIAVRAGLHCAPFAHKTAGTLGTGTVRVSVSAFNNESEIDFFTEELREIIRKK